MCGELGLEEIPLVLVLLSSGQRGQSGSWWFWFTSVLLVSGRGVSPVVVVESLVFVICLGGGRFGRVRCCFGLKEFDSVVVIGVGWPRLCLDFR
ncbi:hypothetical protein Drorol1_Dr00020485 [Drosera rotundifolia]